jgi:hypothetical protein
MTLWEDFNFEDRISEILREVPDSAENHQLGRAYLTPYQIAIEFKLRYPEDFERIDKPLGGIGTGQRNSLSQYIAQRLSALIGAGQLSNIEGGFLSNMHLSEIRFDDDGEPVVSSLTGTQFTLSMFRWVE